jgi:hypothetical protein
MYIHVFTVLNVPERKPIYTYMYINNCIISTQFLVFLKVYYIL